MEKAVHIQRALGRHVMSSSARSGTRFAITREGENHDTAWEPVERCGYGSDDGGTRGVHSPQNLVAKNDHAGLETWYVKEAAHLRQRTKDMMAMTEEYKKIPSRPGSVPAKIMLVQPCQTLSATYAKAADEAEMMARTHREMTGR